MPCYGGAFFQYITMAWSVNEIFGFVKYLTLKNQAGSISATDLFYMWNNEQNAYQDDLLGKWQNRANGKTGANTGLILNETIKQKLSPFTLPITLTIASGVVTKPTDFIYELALRMNATGGTAGSRIDKIDHDQIYSVIESVIDAPSVPNDLYYAVEYENYYQLYPTNVAGNVSLDYVAQCRDIKWGFTYDADKRQVYNAGTSVQPQWSQNVIVEITKRALKSLGLHFKDQDFEQYGQSNIQTGN